MGNWGYNSTYRGYIMSPFTTGWGPPCLTLLHSCTSASKLSTRKKGDWKPNFAPWDAWKISLYSWNGLHFLVVMHVLIHLALQSSRNEKSSWSKKFYRLSLKKDVLFVSEVIWIVISITSKVHMKSSMIGVSFSWKGSNPKLPKLRV